MATKKAAAKKTAAKESKPAAKTAAKKSAATSVPANEEALGTTHEAQKPGGSKQKPEPTHDEIAKLAHRYWEERGGHHGSHHDDWLRAVKDLGSN